MLQDLFEQGKRFLTLPRSTRSSR